MLTSLAFTVLLAAASAPLLSSAQAVSASSSAAVNRTSSTFVIPFYSAPNTFTPTAVGNTPIPGVVATLTNTAGAGSLSDTFTYTKASATVPPTGTVTITPTGAAASINNLQPNPANLQTAAARRMADTASTTFYALVSLSTIVALGLGALVVVA